MFTAMKTTLLPVALLLAVCLPSFGQTPHKTKNLVIVLMDGYRWKELFEGADSSLLFNGRYSRQDSAAMVAQFWAPTAQERRAKLMPFFWGVVAQHGQLYGNRNYGNNVNVRNGYWFSYPGRNEVFTGYADSLVNSNEYPDNPNLNVLEYINAQHGYQGKVVTFASWDAVARILNRHRNGMLVNIDGEDVQGANLTAAQQAANLGQHAIPSVLGKGERLDGLTYAMAKAYMTAEHPRVLYLDFGDTDDFAHEAKYNLYLQAANAADAMMGDLWAYIQEDPFYKDQTTILVCPDHGRGYANGWTSHGRSFAHSNETYLVVMGPDTPPTGEMKTAGQIYQEQYAQTMAALLGFTFEASHPIGTPVTSVIAR